jgi:hypothetical protein
MLADKKAQMGRLGNVEVRRARLDDGRGDEDFPGSLDQADITSAFRRRRAARHAAQRRRQLQRAAAWGGAVVVALAFAGGLVWRKGWLHHTEVVAPVVEVDLAQRSEACRLFDEAVRARHEERLQGASNAINEARRLDPDLPGLDLFIGEIAWEKREPATIQRAARESLRRGHHESAAKLLLALEKWMSRSPQDTVTVGASVRELLVEAVEASPASAPALFFQGELSRLLGDTATAHRALRGALHRQTPWHSTALLATKWQLAAAEASQLGRASFAPAPDAQAQAALNLRNAVLAGDDASEALNALLFATPSLHAMFLLQDAAFYDGDAGEAVRAAREQLDPSVPHGGI